MSRKSDMYMEILVDSESRNNPIRRPYFSMARIYQIQKNECGYAFIL